MQAGGQPTYVLGNKEAHNVIKIQYCGGWGYKPHADAFVAKIEKVLPGKFIYHYYADPGKTGNFEVTVWFGSQTENGEGVFIYSKQATKAFPAETDPLFETLHNGAKWVTLSFTATLPNNCLDLWLRQSFRELCNEFCDA